MQSNEETYRGFKHLLYDSVTLAEQGHRIIEERLGKEKNILDIIISAQRLFMQQLEIFIRGDMISRFLLYLIAKN